MGKDKLGRIHERKNGQKLVFPMDFTTIYSYLILLHGIYPWSLFANSDMNNMGQCF